MQILHRVIFFHQTLAGVHILLIADLSINVFLLVNNNWHRVCLLVQVLGPEVNCVGGADLYAIDV